MNNREAIKQLENILNTQCNTHYKQGLYEGYLVAQQIYWRYSGNHQLANPETIEQLDIWTLKDLQELMNKSK